MCLILGGMVVGVVVVGGCVVGVVGVVVGVVWVMMVVIVVLVSVRMRRCFVCMVVFLDEWFRGFEVVGFDCVCCLVG